MFIVSGGSMYSLVDIEIVLRKLRGITGGICNSHFRRKISTVKY